MSRTVKILSSGISIQARALAGAGLHEKAKENTNDTCCGR